MDLAADEPPRVEKRPIQNGAGGELGPQLSKKPRLGPDCERDLKRVAEIVLALSTMAKIRGGEKPTEPEIGLMEEARAKLVELCEGLPPKEIVAKDAISAVIEDLGLNAKLNEQRLGFRGPKLTIAEKFALTKRKMDESKKYAAQTAAYPSQPLKTSFNVAAENHGLPHTVRISTDNPNHAPISTGGFAASPLVHVSTVTPTSAQYQLPTSEIRTTMVSGSVPGSHLGRDSSSPAFPRGERVQLRTDGGSNGSSYAYQVQANSSANHPPVSAPTWPTQTQGGPENKVPNHTSVKVEGTTGMSKPSVTPLAARDQNSRSFASQPSSGHLPGGHQSSQKIRFVQASSVPNNHTEIARIIQKLLQPQLPDHPTWIPPSRDYMSKALTCQTCQISINEVDNVLICDACEKGYHITCAQSPNQRGIPRGEWHCTRCLSLSNGKPLPPKYGRVMRSNIQLKAGTIPSSTVASSTVPSSTVPSSTIASSTAPSSTVPSSMAVVQMSSGNKVGALDPKVYEQKINAHVSSVFQNPAHLVGVGTNNIKSATDSKVSFAMQGNNLPSSSVNADEKPLSGSFLLSETSSQQIGNSELSTSDKRPMESRAEPSSDLSNKDADPKISTASETEGTNFPSSSKTTDEKILSGSFQSGERTSQQRDISESFKSDKRPSESRAESPTDLPNKDSDPNILSATETQGNNFPSSSQSTDEKPVSGSFMSSERSSREIDNSESSRLFESSTEPPADLSNKDADSKISNAREMQGNNFSTSSKGINEKPLPGSFPSSESSSQQTDNSELSILDKIPYESKTEPPADLPNEDIDKSVPSQPVSNSEVVDRAGAPNCGENSSCSIRDDQGLAQEHTSEGLVVSGGALEHTGFTSDGLRPVEWIGDSIQDVSEKNFYRSCRIDGVTYELQEHALFQSSHGKLIPSKLQSMWEDRKTGSKWVIVNSCYFPSDLPEHVSRPSTPESNEVYESNHETTVMAGLIQGPCEVLPPAKFSEEIERRSQLGHDTNNELRPVFLCKWNYDEFKGLLQTVSQ
ncbi:putative chromatin regulator PHD family [Rosa chinensis]|uniref:Putative chromatin regulator PHD family n=1 Tax=Rosa chinensis TaxID=74649 RepID=A0A2P6QCU7_ROSCH|nr:endochitinase A isoform X1 [Rosa chinensis]PRQ32000.1 putative chromatin regulator PHD family [Rosa chinensis]